MARRTFIAATVLSVSALGLTACGSDADPVASGTCAYSEDGSATPATLPPTQPSVSGTVNVSAVTTAGDLNLTLDADGSPCTVNSWVSLASQGFFADMSCHRLTLSGIFVLQCGDPEGSGQGGPGYEFADELTTAKAQAEGTPWGSTKTTVYPAGTVAMANAGADTNGSQFFLVYDDSELPPAYTVFGSMDADTVTTVREIAAEGTTDGSTDGTPAAEVTFSNVTVK